MDTSRTWVEIDLQALEHNYNELRKLAPNSRFAGLVKANAYGHGAVAIAKKLEQLGADYLAVACIAEALELRSAGVKTPIIILGYTPVSFTKDLIDNDITQTVYDYELAKQFSENALSYAKKLKCHLKADTGMSRLGILCELDNLETAVSELYAMYNLEGLDVEGIFQHFADADTSPEYSKMQIARFKAVVSALESKNCNFKIKHCCAGAASLNYPEVHYDMIRPGILLYGYSPDHSCDGMIDVKPVMTLKSRIASVKNLPEGTCVSYGRTYTLSRDSKIAAVPIGYADGLPRLLSSNLTFYYKSQPVKQIGRICMDMCMIDVTGVENIKIGEEITIFGKENNLQVMADTMGTITYELMCGISPRVKRIIV